MLYVWILIGSISGPLLFSFLPQVKFYKHWHIALLASGVVSLLFIPWDIYFTKKGIWGFTEQYLLGVYYWGLPLEEILFFIFIPFCSLFVYECIERFTFFRKSWYTYALSKKKIVGVGFLFIICWVFVQGLHYTASVVGGSGLLLMLYAIKPFYRLLEWGRFLLAYVLVGIPFLIVNGMLTYYPVVWYNNAENLGIRVFSIPVEDFLYQFILFSLNVVIFNFAKATLFRK